ncbi:MAG: DUF2202 domain-containing protein [Micropruina sp.]|nr:MAG: DUF2202 domain-containing protein [Micropruina sp.]
MGGDRSGRSDHAPSPTPTATAKADATLVKNLTFMREEERMARDLYTAFAAQYGQGTAFARIATSEQRHFETMGLLLSRYGIADPAANAKAGTFADASLQELYTKLLAQGKESLTKAYQAGKSVETEDIADLDTAIKETTAADAKAAFENLRRGSQQHLAAYTALADGKTLGTQMGQGMRQGGRWNTDGSAPNNGQQGRWGTQDGTRGPGMGPRSTTRPTDCPVR